MHKPLTGHSCVAHTHATQACQQELKQKSKVCTKLHFQKGHTLTSQEKVCTNDPIGQEKKKKRMEASSVLPACSTQPAKHAFQCDV